MVPKNDALRHVAIIMDGNRRWAEMKGLPLMEGHRAGAEAVKKVIKACGEIGIKYLTLFAFSTENWKRPKPEVESLMSLLSSFLRGNMSALMENNLRLRAVGKIDQLPEKTRNVLADAVKKTEGNAGGTVVLALNYGGRAEIIDGIRKILQDAENGKPGVNSESVTEEMFRNYLYAPDIPDPDLLIRTSGEMRISNFLLWQISYSEIWVTDKLWPDFDGNELKKAAEDYCLRERRYGGR